MREVRGLARPTIIKYGSEARQFLAWLGGRANVKTLRSLGIEEIDRYIAWRMPGLRRATRVDVCICMRSFLRYLHAERWTGQDLSLLVSGPPVYAFSEIPRAFTEEQVQSLLAAAQSDPRPSGLRDHAILMLLAMYGLRAGEVLRLRLEDIDWRESKLHVRRSKTSIESTLPLVDPVGNALLKYLREARPKTHFREVFLRVRAPYEPLRHGALFTVIGHRLKQAGIEVRGRRGAHAFRYARAASLLTASVPLKTIGDLLGHQSAESTGIYLRLPIDDLRTVSLEVPGRSHGSVAR
jgi:site-specific recombinase XerD